MAEKKEKYMIYGTTPGTTTHPQPPIGGSQQPTEMREMEELKARVERVLQGLDIKYPIRSKAEFINIVEADLPDICDPGRRKLSLRDLISILRDDDFPINSVHEAATLLAASCPISARAAE
jgi:hypothetical protein